MGGSESTIENPGFDQQQYTALIVSPENIQRYGEIKAYMHNTNNQRVALLKLVFQQETKFIEAENQCKNLNKLDHDSIVKIKDVYRQVHEELCSNFWTISLLYEFVECDLRQEFLQRQEKQINYNESELWHILVSVIAALAYLKSNDCEQGDIRPYSILVNEEGKVKILPKNSFGSSISSFQEQTFSTPSNNGVYLSPAQLVSLENKQSTSQGTQSKTDVFNLGLTVLECALMRPLPEIIDLQNFNINEHALQDALAQVRQLYGETLHSFLVEMLLIDEEQRPDVENLFQKIESLCQQGIQVADRLFQLRDGAVPFQAQQAPAIVQSPNPHQEPIVERKLSSCDQSRDNCDQVTPDDRLHYHEKINQCNQDYPDLHNDQVEVVKRSKHFKTDNNNAVLAKETIVDGIDPRITTEYEEVETIKRAGHTTTTTTHNHNQETVPSGTEYKFSGEVEKILEEYRLKSQINQQQVESIKHTKHVVKPQPQQSVVTSQVQPVVQHIQQVQQQVQPVTQYVQQQPITTTTQQYVNQSYVQPANTYVQPTTTIPQQSQVIRYANQSPVKASNTFQTTTTVPQSQVNGSTIIRQSQASPQGFVRKQGIPAGAKIISESIVGNPTTTTTVVNQQEPQPYQFETTTVTRPVNSVVQNVTQQFERTQI